MVSFIVYGEPQGKARPRVVHNNGVIRAYTPQKTKDYEEDIQRAYVQNCVGVYFDGDIEVCIKAYFSIPASASKVRKRKMMDGEIFPNKKPDLDNIAKVVCDALNGIAYKDDASIINLHICKEYAEIPCIVVTIK